MHSRINLDILLAYRNIMDFLSTNRQTAEEVLITAAGKRIRPFFVGGACRHIIRLSVLVPCSTHTVIVIVFKIRHSAGPAVNVERRCGHARLIVGHFEHLAVQMAADVGRAAVQRGDDLVALHIEVLVALLLRGRTEIGVLGHHEPAGLTFCDVHALCDSGNGIVGRFAEDAHLCQLGTHTVEQLRLGLPDAVGECLSIRRPRCIQQFVYAVFIHPRNVKTEREAFLHLKGGAVVVLFPGAHEPVGQPVLLGGKGVFRSVLCPQLECFQP